MRGILRWIFERETTIQTYEEPSAIDDVEEDYDPSLLTAEQKENIAAFINMLYQGLPLSGTQENDMFFEDLDAGRAASYWFSYMPDPDIVGKVSISHGSAHFEMHYAVDIGYELWEETSIIEKSTGVSAMSYDDWEASGTINFEADITPFRENGSIDLTIHAIYDKYINPLKEVSSMVTDLNPAFVTPFENKYHRKNWVEREHNVTTDS